MRDTLIEIKEYFESKPELTEQEELLVQKIEKQLPYFPAVYISRDDLCNISTECLQISNKDMTEIAIELQEEYCESGYFWEDLKIASENVLNQ